MMTSDPRAAPPGYLDQFLTPAEAHVIAWQVREGSHAPAGALRLLALLAKNIEPGASGRQSLSETLADYLHDALTTFLRDPRSGELERLLGLRRPSKRPVQREQGHLNIAHAVLLLRLRGKSLQSASIDVGGGTHHLAANRVRDAWARYRFLALDIERVRRAGLTTPPLFSEIESNRLHSIYRGHIADVTPYIFEHIGETPTLVRIKTSHVNPLGYKHGHSDSQQAKDRGTGRPGTAQGARRATPGGAFSVPEFCSAHRISRAWIHEPEVMRRVLDKLNAALADR